jgi:hypothetical protein
LISPARRKAGFFMVWHPEAVSLASLWPAPAVVLAW